MRQIVEIITGFSTVCSIGLESSILSDLGNFVEMALLLLQTIRMEIEILWWN